VNDVRNAGEDLPERDQAERGRERDAEPFVFGLAPGGDRDPHGGERRRRRGRDILVQQPTVPDVEELERPEDGDDGEAEHDHDRTGPGEQVGDREREAAAAKPHPAGQATIAAAGDPAGDGQVHAFRRCDRGSSIG